MVFNILNVFFLDSVNRSLYNDCFWAILWYFNAFFFLFQFFSTRGVNRNFQCCFSEWRVRYLKGQKWLMLKSATGIIDHGVKTRISVEKRAKVFAFKKNRRSSLLEKRTESQISKSTVAWICDACRQWACIANTTFTQKVPNQVFEICFQPLGVISLYLFAKWYCVTFFDVMRNEFVPFYLHNSTVLSHGSHFKPLKSA